MRSTTLSEALKFTLRSSLLLLLPILLGGWSASGDQMLSGNQSTMVVDGPVAETQLKVFYVTLWVSAVIFVIVGAVLAYATLKFRARSEADEHAEPPPQGHGNPLVEIGLIVVSIVALVFIAVPTVKAIWYTQRVPAEFQKDLMTIKATGYQWWFRFEYPSINVKTAQQGNAAETTLVTANELVIPVDTPIRIDLRSQDVIHSFWLPKIAGKVDMIPNRGNFLWLKASKPGYYWGQCAEYCGEEHGNMRFRAIVLSKEDWAKWVARQTATATAIPVAKAGGPAAKPIAALKGNDRTNFDSDMFAVWTARQQPATDLSAETVIKGHDVFTAKGCFSCHTIRGHSGMVQGQVADFAGIAGPDLTHFGARTTLAAGIRDNTPENLKHWVHEPDVVKPGNKMWREGYNKPADDKRKNDPHVELIHTFRVDEQEADALVAYLHSLR